MNGRNLMGRTFGRVEIFGVEIFGLEIYLNKQIRMYKEERTI
jgi:hypothetical protein